jgi:hypothetical protein
MADTTDSSSRTRRLPPPLTSPTIATIYDLQIAVDDSYIFPTTSPVANLESTSTAISTGTSSPWQSPTSTRCASPTGQGLEESLEAHDLMDDYRASLSPFAKQRYATSPRPLIDHVDNAWMRSGDYLQAQNEKHRRSSSSSSGGFSRLLPRSPKFKKALVLYALWLVASWVAWTNYIQPMWTENDAINSSVDEAIKRTGTTKFGQNVRPFFTRMTQLRTLEPELLPTKGEKKRLIVVGDVHGCKVERTYPFLGIITLLVKAKLNIE